jgi:UTP:GlnB (protein PII) uridylyltransferase
MTGQTGTNATELKERATARLAAAREEYVQQARRGRAGRDAAARYADQMDGVVQAVVGAAAGQITKPFAVCAVGGYGRRAQCLHSDVDLLLVFDGAIGQQEEAFVKSVLQPLWDLGSSLASTCASSQISPSPISAIRIPPQPARFAYVAGTSRSTGALP